MDHSTSHPELRVRVTYPSPAGKNLFKDLPAASVGKLRHYTHLRELPDVSLWEENDRSVGYRCSIKDLGMVTFGPSFRFGPGHLVVVPRSTGGFSYGRVLRQQEIKCPSAPKGKEHSVLGWRIIVSPGEQRPRVWKDLAPGYIGKLHIPENERIPTAEPKLYEEKGLTTQAVAQIEHVEKSKFITEWLQQEDTLSGSESDSSFSDEEIVFEGEGSTDVDSVEKEKANSARLPRAASEAGVAQKKGVLTLPAPQMEQMRKDRRQQRVVVVDGPNVAMRHGGHKKAYSIKGLKACIDHYLGQGCDVVAFLPEHYLKRKETEVGGDLHLSDFIPVTTNVELLEKLMADGNVVLTPAQDYDDSYCLQYAKSVNGCIVSNDRFWDHIDTFKGPEKTRVKKWVHSHTISFTFVRDDFMPNPDFKWPA